MPLKRFFNSGPPLLHVICLFGPRSDRSTQIILLPLITLIYPLFKLVPPTYDWRMRSRINRCIKDFAGNRGGY